ATSGLRLVEVWPACLVCGIIFSLLCSVSSLTAAGSSNAMPESITPQVKTHAGQRTSGASKIAMLFSVDPSTMQRISPPFSEVGVCHRPLVIWNKGAHRFWLSVARERVVTPALG